MSDNTDTNDRAWGINVNLSGLVAPTGNTNVEQGYYKGKVTDMYTKPEKPGRVIIKLTVAEGPFAGAVRTTGLNVPKDAEDKVRYYWRGLAESVGYTPAELDAGEVNLSIGSFKDRTAHFFYTPKEMSTDGYDSLDFLPVAEWTSRAAGFKPADGAVLGGGGANLGGGSAPVTGAGSTTSADEVRAKLGLS
jgi:hypothetical protein